MDDEKKNKNWIVAMLTKSFYANSPFVCMFFPWFVDVMASQENITTALYAHFEGEVSLSQGRQQFAILFYLIM